MRWWEWSGWAFVGNVAQVLSLLAILFAIYEFAERRRQVPAVEWRFDEFGSGTVDNCAVYFYDFSNVGRGSAFLVSLTVINARLVLSETYRPHPTVLPSSTRTLCIDASSRSEDAWVLLVWRASDDKGFVHFEWMPLVSGSELETKFIDDWTPKRWFQKTHGPFRGRLIEPVGPTGAVRATVRSSRNANVGDRRTGRAFEVMLGSSPISSWTSGATTVSPLPPDNLNAGTTA